MNPLRLWLCAIASLSLLYGDAAALTPEQSSELEAEAAHLIAKGRELEALGALDRTLSDRICDVAADYAGVEELKSRQHRTPFHESVAEALSTQASLYMLCHPPLAEKYLESLLRVKEHLYGSESAEAAEVHDAMADYYRTAMAEFGRAIAHYERAKAIRTARFGKNDVRSLANNGRLALSIFFHRSDAERADALFSEAIRIAKTTSVKPNEALALAYREYGNFFALRGTYEAAEATLLKAFDQTCSAAERIGILCELSDVAMNAAADERARRYAADAYDEAKAYYRDRPALPMLCAARRLGEQLRASGDIRAAQRLEAEYERLKSELSSR